MCTLGTSRGEGWELPHVYVFRVKNMAAFEGPVVLTRDSSSKELSNKCPHKTFIRFFFTLPTFDVLRFLS